MMINRQKKTLIVLSVIIIILTALSAKCICDRAILSIRMSFALEQVDVFNEMRVRASKSELGEAAACLEYVLHYYPSGTKQIQGSQLDRLVEDARENSMARIISDLRSRTGKDFGDDPQRWIDQRSKSAIP